MRAVFYARVSTDEESQVDALKSQIKEAERCTSQNGWTLIDRYIDEGKSGTTTKKRDEYNRLYDDIESDKFDIIVVKSQDRLMRNTKEWYVFVDKLVTNNKRLFFYIENKFYTPDDALITGIKAILAEEYSRELSKKINNAHRNRQREGKSISITSSTWGYDKINKKVVINEEEAKIVRLIFELYAQGFGSRSICKELTNRGIRSRNGGRFADITVRKIVKNPIFKGTVVMNQRHYDFNSKKTIKNDESEWIYHENAVPRIVSDELWELANNTLKRNTNMNGGYEIHEKLIGKNRGKYDLSGKIVCGLCGRTYWRKFRKNKHGERIVDWSCQEYIRRGLKTNPRKKIIIIDNGSDVGCDGITINEEKLLNVLKDIANDVLNDSMKDTIDLILKTTVKELRNNSSHDKINDINTEINKILKQKDLLLDKLLDSVISNDDYQRKDASLEEKIVLLRTEKEKLQSILLTIEQEEQRMHEIIEEIKTIGKEEIDGYTILKYTNSITVYEKYLEIDLGFMGNARISITGSKKNRIYQYVI